MSNFTNTVSEKFLNTVNRFWMFDNTSDVVVGFSGGADSVCLLHLLNSFKNTFGYKLKAVHVNHGIRGDEAARDECFAESFCKMFKIPFECVRINCIEEAKNSKESLEECGRRLRYEIFNSFSGENSKIATAHNANDNAETIIFNIARGTTIKGLSGIPFVRDNVVRPLLLCSRNEIEGYCKENNLDFIVDSTNLCDDYTRNKIRHSVLPVIEELNPSYLESFASLSDNAYAVSDFLKIQADSLLNSARKNDWVFDREVLLKGHESVVCEAIFKAYYEFSGKKLDNKKVKSIYELLSVCGRKQIYGNDFVEVKRENLRFYKVTSVKIGKMIPVKALPFSVQFNDYTVNLEEFYNNSKIVNQKEYHNMIDFDTVIGNLVIRTREPGDDFTFKKRGVTKTLKKLFTEENIPIEIRDRLPVIADDSGVVWVQGFGVNKRCQPINDKGNIVIVRGEYNDK